VKVNSLTLIISGFLVFEEKYIYYRQGHNIMLLVKEHAKGVNNSKPFECAKNCMGNDKRIKYDEQINGMAYFQSPFKIILTPPIHSNKMRFVGLRPSCN
jgi:hypothetical protein